MIGSPQRPQSSASAGIRRTIVGGLLLNVLMNLFLYIGQLLIIRRLSRDDYAVFAVVSNFNSLMALFADLGLTLLFVRRFAEAHGQVTSGAEEQRGELLGTMLTLRIALALLVCVAVVFLAPALGYPPSTQHLMYIMLITLFISSRLMVVRSVGEAFLRGHDRYHLVALAALVDAIAFAGGIYICGLPSLNLETAVWVYSVCHIPGLLILAWFIGSHAKETGFRLAFRLDLLKQLVRQGAPLMLSTAFWTIHTFADTLLLDKMSTPREVSAFGAGVRIFSALIFLPTVFAAVIAPRITKAVVADHADSIRPAVERFLRILVLIALFGAVSLTVLPDMLLRVLLGGTKYLDASGVVTMFGWMFVPYAVATFLIEVSIAEDRRWMPMVYMAAIMVVSLGLDFILIPSYGAMGAAIARTIGVAVGAAIFVWMARILRSMSVRSLMLLFAKGTIAVAVALGLDAWVRTLKVLPSGFEAIIVLATFLAAIVATRALSLAELRSIVGFAFTNRTE